MAVTSSDPRRGNRLLTRLHYLIRLVGLLGVQSALAGAVLLRPASLDELFAQVDAPELGGYLLLGGAAAALFALLIEVLVQLPVLFGRRSALGINALLQILLAVALLVGVNVWSFFHSARFDWTRDQQFTLPVQVREQLAQLDPNTETTIVLYQRQRSSGLPQEKPDPFDLEAERKVVEKINDLVELFREIGPRFRVETLDVADRRFNDKLDEITRNSPEWRAAILQAPTSSIFIHSGRSVQRLSFNEFYRLDRGASEARDNLVLRAVGPGPIVQQIVQVDERRPRIGILVAHEALSSEGAINEYTFSGAGKALKAAGFEVRDVVLRGPNLEPTLDSLEVTRYDRWLEDLEDLDLSIRTTEREIQALERLAEELPSGSLAGINRLVASFGEQFDPRFLTLRVTESNRELVRRVVVNLLDAEREALVLDREERERLAEKLAGLSGDQLSEQKHLRDLHARWLRNLSDVDLLILPRLTRLPNGMVITPRLHDLDTRQAELVRDFLRRGKPILACLGPTNTPAGLGRPGEETGTKSPDELEKLFAELGIVFGKRTVLFNVEKRGFADRMENIFRQAEPIQVPPLRLESAALTFLEPTAAVGVAAANGLFALPFVRPRPTPWKPNPIRESLRLAKAESGGRLELRSRFLRPVFLDPVRLRALNVDPEVLATDAAAWHDEQPFRTRVRPVPRFEPPAPDDPDNGTLEMRRRGPFGVGVAIETRLPPEWGSERTVRVAAIGQAGLFTGPELTPAQERLLLDTCNWLLGREERLAADVPEWSYPRVRMSEEAERLWLLGARWGLPELFAFLGLVMLLTRRLR